MKKEIFIAAAVLFSSYVQAQTDSVRTLDEVVVTATKSPIKQSQTGKVVDVIDKLQLQRSFGKTIGEVLNSQPGLVINGADNDYGTNQTVYLQGASAGNTLILMDGVPLYDASGISSEFDLNNFALDNVERIEILKGAQSTLYGSDAVAGVINIVTKKSGENPFDVNVDLSGGSYATYKGSIALSGSSNDKGQSYFVSYNRLQSKGFSSAYDSTGNATFDKDGFRRDVLHVNYSFKPFTRTSVRLFGKYNDNHAAVDAGAFMDDKDYTNHNDNFIGGLVLDRKVKNGFIRAQYSYNRFNRNFLDDSTDVGGYTKFQKGKYNGTSHFAELYASLSLSKHFDLLAGADFRSNSSSQLYIYIPDYGFPALPISADSAITRQFSGYASLTFKNKKGFNAEAGGRWNVHNIYGSNATYSFNPYFLAGQHLKLFANLSSGYRVPSIYQLYSEYGNKKLRPEQTASFEGGAGWTDENMQLRVTAFLRDGKNVFYFYTDPVTFASRYINADKQHDEGFEAEVKYLLSPKLSASANYTFTNGHLVTNNADNKDTSYFNLYKRPKNVVNLSLDYQPLNSLFLSVSLKTVSKAFEPRYGGPDYRLNGYYTIGFYGDWKLSKRFKVFLDLENITDRKYFVTRGFTTKGFNFNAGLKASF